VARNLSSACSIEGCNHRAIAKGLCDRHYKRFQRTGSPYKTGRAGRPRKPVRRKPRRVYPRRPSPFAYRPELHRLSPRSLRWAAAGGSGRSPAYIARLLAEMKSWGHGVDPAGLTDEMIVAFHQGTRLERERRLTKEIAALLGELRSKPDMSADERIAKATEIQHRLDVMTHPVVVDGGWIGPNFYPPARGTGESYFADADDAPAGGADDSGPADYEDDRDNVVPTDEDREREMQKADEEARREEGLTQPVGRLDHESACALFGSARGLWLDSGVAHDDYGEDSGPNEASPMMRSSGWPSDPYSPGSYRATREQGHPASSTQRSRKRRARLKNQKARLAAVLKQRKLEGEEETEK
jgi:hypothetical protein